MNAIQISNVTISQTENLYSLADLHKASGGNSKHQPAFWLRNQQTQELIAEIEAQGKQAVQTINGGSKRGTYVCRELVVSYGMWISAAFALQVIQVFLAAQEPSGSPQPRALPGLTAKQQTEVKALHNLLVQSVPFEKQKGLAITLWSAVKAKFKVGYKDVPAEQFPEVLSLMARVAVEKGVQYREAAALELETVPKLFAQQANIPFDLERNESYMVTVRGGKIYRHAIAYMTMPHWDAQIPCLAHR